MTGAPGGITPDDRDWTWVLERTCPECGFDAAAVEPERVGAQVRSLGDAWVAVLGRPAEVVRRRPRPDRWSPLEYACHVRDVFVLFDERLALMLAETDPSFANWDQDATAVESDYAGSEVDEVAAAIGPAAARLAERFEAVTGAQWGRTGRRDDRATFTVDSFARYLLHDPVHHLWDVGAPATEGADRG